MRKELTKYPWQSKAWFYHLRTWTRKLQPCPTLLANFGQGSGLCGATALLPPVLMRSRLWRTWWRRRLTRTPRRVLLHVMSRSFQQHAQNLMDDSAHSWTPFQPLHDSPLMRRIHNNKMNPNKSQTLLWMVHPVEMAIGQWKVWKVQLQLKKPILVGL